MEAGTTAQRYQLFKNPNSDFFLETNTKRLYELAKTDANLFPVTHSEINHFKHSIESISRNFEQRTLRARKRHLSYRSWLSFGPLNILLGKNRCSYTVLN